MIFPEEFEQFVEDVSLGAPQRERILNSSDSLIAHLSDALSLPRECFFLQGSFVNGTAVNPPSSNSEGEYDVDLVVVMAEQSESADAALDRLFEAIAAHGRYQGRLSRRKPCIRIEYAEDSVGKFHIDVIPLKDDVSFGLMAPRAGEGWHVTRPQEYAEWCMQLGDQFSKTVRILKRWRDEHLAARQAVKSIVLQVLVAKNLGTSADESSRLRETLNNLLEALSHSPHPPIVSNPVLPEENLSGRWTNKDYQAFKQELIEAVDLAVRAEDSPEDAESSMLWRKLLGEDFPEIVSEENAGIGSTAHAWTLERNGWTENLDPDAEISMEATVFHHGSTKPHKKFFWRGFLSDGVEILYVAKAIAPYPVEIWWQVINTGPHAKKRDGLRGDFFRAKDRAGKESANRFENWERSLYTGTHLIEVFALKGTEVVARSTRRHVPIENRAVPPKGRRRNKKKK